MNPPELRDLVRRVVARTMRAPTQAPSRKGVHVEVGRGSSTARLELAPERGLVRGQVVTAEDLVDVADGAAYELPRGARLTALAQDEVQRRGLRLQQPEASGLTIALGADHGGYAVKQHLADWMRAQDHRVLDLGTHDEGSVDYPDFAEAVARAVADGRAELGVCVDGAGIGSAMAANKVPGVRAALCYDVATAQNAREHNFANVLSLGGPRQGAELCTRILQAFLETPEGPSRHERRVRKIMEIEARATGRLRPVQRVLGTRGAT